MIDNPQDDDQLEPDINQFSLLGNVESDQLDQATLDIESLNLTGDSDYPQPKMVRRGTPVSQSLYHIRSLGHVLGPVTWDTLAEMMTSGSLSSSDEIKIDDGDWVATNKVPGLKELEPLDKAQSGPAKATSQEAGISPNQKQDLQAVPQDASRPGKRSPLGKKRKRKKPKVDPLLKEIFEEVFTDVGSLRDREPVTPSAPPTSSKIEPSTPAPTENSAFRESTPTPAAAAAAAPIRRPPTSKKPGKKRGNSVSMPQPKTLGIVGGLVLVAGVAIAMSMGLISLPGTSVDAEPFFKQVAAAFPAANAGNAAEWRAFVQKYSQEARDLKQALNGMSGPKVDKYQEAASAVLKLTRQSFKAKERQQEVFDEMQQSLAGIVSD